MQHSVVRSCILSSCLRASASVLRSVLLRSLQLVCCVVFWCPALLLLVSVVGVKFWFLHVICEIHMCSTLSFILSSCRHSHLLRASAAVLRLVLCVSFGLCVVCFVVFWCPTILVTSF